MALKTFPLTVINTLITDKVPVDLFLKFVTICDPRAMKTTLNQTYMLQFENASTDPL